jgi:hypothetical protein
MRGGTRGCLVPTSWWTASLDGGCLILRQNWVLVTLILFLNSKFCLGVWLVGAKTARLCSSLEGWRKFVFVFFYLFFPLWDYEILILFVCWTAEFPLNSFVYRNCLFVLNLLWILFSDAIKHILCCLENRAFCSMTVGRVVCFVMHPKVKAMNRSLPCIWVQGERWIFGLVYFFFSLWDYEILILFVSWAAEFPLNSFVYRNCFVRPQFIVNFVFWCYLT